MKIPEKLPVHLSTDLLNVVINQNKIIDCLHDIEARLPKPEAPKRWRAEHYEKYWFLPSGGEVDWMIEVYDNGDNFRYNTGNYFKTEAEAIAYREQLLANGK